MATLLSSRTSSLHLVPGSDILTEFTDDGSLWQIAGNLLLLSCGWMRDREVLGIPAPRQPAPGTRAVGV